MIDHAGLRRFMSDSETLDAFGELGTSSTVAFFVGAGTSKEIGLPSWAEMVDSLLQVVARNSNQFRMLHEQRRVEGVAEPLIVYELAEQASAYSRWTVATHGLLGAAAVVKAWLTPSDYRAAIEQCLYQPVRDGLVPFEPGPTCLEIAATWESAGGDNITVVTTNYDLLLERALETIGVDPSRIASLVTPGSGDSSEFTVYHIHGIVPDPGACGVPASVELVLAEDEYFAPNDAAAQARREFCESVLASNPSLFLGTSLTDPNLLSYLYRSATLRNSDPPRHYTLAIKQGDQPPGIEADATVLATGRATAANRLQRMNVLALQADFFCQNAQFLSELRSIRRDAATHVPYEKRIGRWEHDAADVGLLPSSSSAFLSTQPRLREALSAGTNNIERLLADKPSLRCEGEHLGLHLWIYQPATDELVFIARSDQEFFSPQTLERHEIAMPIPRLVVEAVCYGTVLEASGDSLRSSRWRSMLVTPIVLDGDQHFSDGTRTGRLPVGALVLASDQEGKRGLSRLRDSPEERSNLISTLAAVGSFLLDPQSHMETT